MPTASQLWCIPSELQAQATSPLAQEACQSASYLLWALSGRKFTGYTTVTETYDYPASPTYTVDGLTVSTGYTYFLLEYAGTVSTRLRLRGKPVVAVSEVRDATLDEVLDPTLYELDDHSVLRFDYALSHSIDVTYTYGGNVPIAGKMAARMLAMEFVKLWTDDDSCMLPSRVTTVTRQNVSMTILDRQDFIADLRTGVYAVDLFLKSVNPYKATKRAKVFSPDIPRGRRKSQ